jgi:cytoskeletal protein RodZ
LLRLLIFSIEKLAYQLVRKFQELPEPREPHIFPALPLRIDIPTPQALLCIIPENEPDQLSDELDKSASDLSRESSEGLSSLNASNASLNSSSTSLNSSSTSLTSSSPQSSQSRFSTTTTTDNEKSAQANAEVILQASLNGLLDIFHRRYSICATLLDETNNC